MTDPDNLTHRLLREMRAEAAERHERVQEQIGSLRDEARESTKRLAARLESLRQAVNGESVLGRYAAAGVEDRLDELEKRIAAIEARS